MKRFSTGRAEPPWAGGQTGPMTADVEALTSGRDPGPIKDPVKYVSPLNAAEFLAAEPAARSEERRVGKECVP